MTNKIVVLCNLGGPSSLDEVEGFLLDLLGDPNVIRLPFFLKPFQPMLSKFIVSRRLPKSQQLYKEIGGKSPLVAIARVQAQSVERATGLKTFILMSCGKPGMEELAEELKAVEERIDEAVILPLFPQYSTTTTKTSFEKAEKIFKENFPDTKLKIVRSFPIHPKFVAAWTERIANRLKRIEGPVQIVFSAHGIPQSYVDSGDTYSDELKDCVAAIMKCFPGQDYILTFQSKFGPGKWLTPATDKYLEALPAGKQILIVPISFVSDHVETLHEIGIEFAHLAKEKGVKLYRTPGLNNSQLFIECLKELIESA